MIEIKNLTKIYRSKKKNNFKALDDINLILPNSGLIFVLGKSGSGKSTLLNLIGGLDGITQGEIVVDGNDISNFKEKQYCDYRNNHIGFIFQDYHLIDELTVYDNIVLSLNLRQIEDKDSVINALKKVDLANYENRYPSELSGGERQRVAIARAIVKRPRIILADEPTGNLDTVTSKQIIELLKSLAKECLVLIVSHNINDAYKYADRIIELSKGKIIKDQSRNPNYKDGVFLHDNNIYYPCDKTLNDDDIDLINSNLTSECKLIKMDNKYIPSLNTKHKNDKIKIVKSKLSLFNTFKMCLKFLKSKIFRITLSSIITSAIIVILALSITIIEFDGSQIIQDELAVTSTKDIVLKKIKSKDISKTYNSSYVLEIEDGDLDSFYNTGYKGEINKLYANSMYIKTNSFSYGNDNGLISNSSIYPNFLAGTLVCDKEFIIDRLGEFSLICEAEHYEKGGFYITDYVADSIILNIDKYKTYNDILGVYNPVTVSYGYINGIIKTDYKTRFIDIISKISNMSTSELKEYILTKEYQDFYNYAYNYLAIGYSFEKNFSEHFANSSGLTWMGNLGIMDIYKDNEKYSIESTFINKNSLYDLKENECAFTYRDYNALFDTNYTPTNLDTFVPHTIKVYLYRNNDSNKQNIIETFEITIKQLVPSINAGCMFLNETLFEEIAHNATFCYSLYFNDFSNVSSLYDVGTKNGYSMQSYIGSSLVTMTKAVEVFIPIFRLIAIVLCSGIILILSNFSIKMIKDKLHDIGILKALGTQNNSIGRIFGLQICLIAILTMIMSTIGYFFFVNLANDVLVESLRKLAPTHVMLDLDFLTFKWDVVFMNMILILLLCIISLFIPLIKIKNIKPVKIIKTKE